MSDALVYASMLSPATVTWQRKSIEAARGRVWRAFVKLWNDPASRSSIETDGGADHPGRHRDNVFDFDDGIRLVVSYSLITYAGESRPRAMVHISADLDPEGPLGGTLPYGPKGFAAFVQTARQRIGDLLAVEDVPAQAWNHTAGKSGRTSPHWLLEPRQVRQVELTASRN